MRPIKTAPGQAAFKERSALFSARQRSIFILSDGNKTVEQVLAATAGMGTTQADVDHMLAQGFLTLVAPAPATKPAPVAAAVPQAPAPASTNALTHQERYALAMPLATKLTSGLGLFGVRLTLAVERASGYDELLALLPKIKEAVGTKAAQDLERALKE
jgi:hypothetical protein